MSKLEGSSPQSPLVNNKIEYHIGGFTSPYSVLGYKGFLFSALGTLDVRVGKVSEVFLEVDLDKWWQGSYDLKIAENPAVMTEGPLAKNISRNHSAMFRLVDIKNY